MRPSNKIRLKADQVIAEDEVAEIEDSQNSSIVTSFQSEKSESVRGSVEHEEEEFGSKLKERTSSM